MQVHLLRAKCYYAMSKNEPAKVEAVENVFSEMLMLNPKIDFGAYLQDGDLLTIANRVLGSIKPPETRSFEFKEVKPAKAKVGKPKTVRIEIVPKTLGVRFDVDKKPPRVTVTRIDSTALLVTYIADSTEIGTTQDVKITATGTNTWRSTSLQFRVTKEVLPFWVYAAAVEIAFITAALLGP